MGRLLGKLYSLSPRIRYVGSGVLAVLAIFLLWFFVFRNTTGSSPGLLATPPPRPALGKSFTFSQYNAAVDSALADVRAARALSGNDRSNKLKNAANTLDSVEGGGVSDGAGSGFAQVDNTTIIAELRDNSPELDAIESKLSALSSALQQGRGAMLAGTANGEKAITELRNVLSDQAFNYERDLSPIDRLTRWLSGLIGEADPGDTLWRWIASLVAAIAAGALTFLASERLGNRWARLGLSAFVGLLVGALLNLAAGQIGTTIEVLAAMGLLVAAIAAALIFSGLYVSSAPPSKPQGISELAATLGMSAAEARKRADEAASTGDYRLGIRYRCLALLLALDEAGMLHFDRTATDREHLFRAPGALQTDLQPLLDRFEAVWYGEALVGAEDWAGYTARAAAIEARVADDLRTQRAAEGRLRRSTA